MLISFYFINMNNPLISFIIPFYNIPENLIRGCVDSVMALNLKSHEREIIVVDDGSDIPAEQLLHDYKDSCIIFRQDNKGLSEARNAGLNIAKGEYVQFVDADDKLIDCIYNKCIDSLQKNAPDILKFHYSHSQKPENMDWTEKNYESGTLYMTQNNLEPGACAYIFKRNILKSLRFTPGIYHEDEEFTPLIFLRAGKTVVTDAKPYFYFQRNDSIVSSYSEEKVKKRLDDFYGVILRLKSLYESILSNVNHNTEDNKLVQYIYDVKVDNLSLKALKRKINQASMDYIINVIRLYKKVNNNNNADSKIHLANTLENHIDKMKHDGLFPISKAKYTRNYSIFRFVVNNSMLRKLLLFNKI